MEEQESLVNLISGLGETSTLHGIPKIVSSRQRIVKTFWCLLLLGEIFSFKYTCFLFYFIIIRIQIIYLFINW